jgi:hypothetical protein
MGWVLFWPLLGALIGVSAAQKKGFSTTTGVISGLLLGPLAFLMFFVSGVFSASEQQRKCPYCAEWIRPEASVCKHCHKDVPPVVIPIVDSSHRGRSAMSAITIGALVITGLLFALIGYVLIFGP